MLAIPRNDSIFVIPFEPSEKSKGGIILTDFSKKRPTEGVVVALGPGVKDKMIVKGARVIYGPFAPHSLKIPIDFGGEEREAYIMNEKDIIAVVEDEKKSDSNNPRI